MHTFLRALLRIFLFAIILTCNHSSAFGQQVHNLALVRYENSDGEGNKGGKAVEKKAEEGIIVYSFAIKKVSEKALNKLKGHQTDELEKQDDFLDSAWTDNDGIASLKIPTNGWLIISDINSDIHFLREFTLSDAAQSLVKIRLEGESRRIMRTIEKVEYRGGRKKKATATGSSCGGTLVLDPYPIITDSIYARSNARFVLSPVVVSRHNPKDTIGFLPPRVLDGVDYDPSQVRYTGFDQVPIGNRLYNKNDVYFRNNNIIGGEPLSGFFNKGMKNREQDTIYFQCRIHPYNDKEPWKIIGHYWYEDYNTVYYENNMLLYAGYSKNPNPFLEWKSFVPKEELDVTHYLKKALTTPIRNSEELKLLFEVNKATLDFTDSLTRENLEYMRQRIDGYYKNEMAVINDVSIHGFASPEGSQTGNERLANARAQTVRNLFASYFSDRSRIPLSTSSYSIVPWTEVADTIEALNDERYAGIANEIKEICQQKSTLDAQYSIIRNKSWYRLVNDSILPRMRRVRITTEVVEQKVLTADEIYQRYSHDNEDFLNEATPPYQYYQLMNLLYSRKEWDKLQHVAQKAFNSRDPLLREQTTRAFMTNKIKKIEAGDDGKMDTIFEVRDTIKIERAYPLAAYYLAKCKLEKLEVDTTILVNYLDKNANGGEYVEKNGGAKWNEEPIVITQILMYCLAEKYDEAYKLAQYHLPDNGKYKLFMSSIKYLSCNYTPEEKEEIRRTIEVTSPANFVAVNLTEDRDPDDGNKTGFQRAKEKLLTEKRSFMRNGKLLPSYYYLLAICRYQTDCNDKDYETYYYDSKNVYDPHNDLGKTSPYTELGKDNHWAMPMLDAFRRDPKWVEFLKEDGFFNDAYRSMMLYFWQRIQDGVNMADIAREYDKLARKYFEKTK